MRRTLDTKKKTWSDFSSSAFGTEEGSENEFQTPAFVKSAIVGSNNNAEIIAEKNKQFQLELARKQNEIDISNSKRTELQSAFSNTYSGGVGGSGSPGSYLSNLANVESGDNWNALNQGSKAFGKFQFIPSTEKEYASKLGISIDEARTPRGQMAMVSAFTNDNRNGLVNAGFEPTQKNMYMAHQQGLGGALTMLRGGQASKANLQGNGVNSTDEWNAKFGHRFS